MESFLPYTFSPLHWSLLIGILVFLWAALILTFKKKYGLAVFSTLVLALLAGLFAVTLDPYLHLWDEQYHAVVAKKMVGHPFQPMLYTDPVHPFDYTNWTGNHIWLHKQPLFLWQIAGSIALFGETTFAVRFPGVVMHVIQAYFIYRMGRILVSPTVGIFASLLSSFAFYPLALMGGFYPTDQNDVAFLFYFTGSIWSFFEYQQTKNKGYLILIGVMCGGAVLVKWLMGTLIFVVWLLYLLIYRTFKNLDRKDWGSFITAGTIATLIFLPWQIYVHLLFPKESKYEHALNQKHLFDPIEHHQGDWTFHFDQAFGDIYGTGTLIAILAIIGLTSLFISIENKKNRFVLFSALIFIYGIYTFAATKMISFTIIALPFIMLGIATFLYQVIRKRLEQESIRPYSWILIIVILPLLFISFMRIQKFDEKDYYSNSGFESISYRMTDQENIKKLGQDFSHEETWVFFMADKKSPYAHITGLFYTPFTFYDGVPSANEIQHIIKKGYKIGIVCYQSSLKKEYVEADTILVFSENIEL